jgi:hypothetical protein
LDPRYLLSASIPQVAATADDAFEDNDDRLHAANLGTLTSRTLSTNLALADRADWYRFRLDRAPDASGDVQIRFQHAQGDLDLSLYDAQGRLVRRSNGTRNSERVSLAGLSSGEYDLLVYGYRGAMNPRYALEINPGNVPVDDSFEENDSLAQAANLGKLDSPRTVSNLVLADGHDWYQFQWNGSSRTGSYVAVAFQHSRGDLDLGVYDATGRLVTQSDGVTNSERVPLDGLAAGTYYVDVHGYAGATNPQYTLDVDPGVYIVPSTPSAPLPSTSSAFQIDVTMRGLTSSQQTIVRDAAASWQQVVVGDLPDQVYNGRLVDDLAVDVSVAYIDGPGGILGGANADRFRPGSLLPYHGTIEFDSADLAQMEAAGTLRDVVRHEIGHVLGIGTLWQSRGLLVGAETSNPRFTGAQATAEYNAVTSSRATSVPVESSGGPGTRDAHWRESVFGNELMTGYVGPGGNLPLSRVTIASLADLGYHVNLAAADPFSLP